MATIKINEKDFDQISTWIAIHGSYWTKRHLFECKPKSFKEKDYDAIDFAALKKGAVYIEPNTDQTLFDQFIEAEFVEDMREIPPFVRHHTFPEFEPVVIADVITNEVVANGIAVKKHVFERKQISVWGWEYLGVEE